MLSGAVSFVLGEIVARMVTGIGHHHPVTGDLGHDGSGGNGKAKAITLYYAGLGNIDLRKGQVINEEKVRSES